MSIHLDCRLILVTGLALALIATSCSGDDSDSGQTAGPGTSGTNTISVVSGDASTAGGSTLEVKLSRGEASATVPAVVHVVAGRPLDDQSVAAVADRLPEWIPDDGDSVAFSRPAETLPRPRVGDTVDVAFPAPLDSVAPIFDSGPLEVLRYQPNGDVGLAPFVSVTFNQPMVALGTFEQGDALDVPAILTPALTGRWQWIGTRTLRFEHDPNVFDRLPMATHYTVEIPAGTAAVSGEVLSEAVSWTFTTPPPKVQSLMPQGDSLPLESVFVATFDQRVDQDAVLSVINLAAGGQYKGLRLATPAEIEADDVARAATQGATDGTWVAFRASDTFESDQTITIGVGPDVASVEGLDTNAERFDYQAHTFRPLRIDNQSCASLNRCEPGSGMSIGFNNVLDPASIDPTLLTIDPAIPGTSISIQWSDIYIQGDTAGDTTYNVTIPGSLADEFGQTLGADAKLEFRIGPATPLIEQMQQQIITLDPLTDGQTFPVIVRGHRELRVRIYAVGPDDWTSYQRHLESRWNTDGPVTEPNFPLLYDEAISTNAGDNTRLEVPIDLEPVLRGNHGQVVVTVAGIGRYADLGPNDNDFWSNQPVEVWVQDTDIGVDLIADASSAVAWTTDLRTGEPLARVRIEASGQPGEVATGADGLATLALGQQSTRPMVARLGDDVAINPTWIQRSEIADQSIWYVVDDRGMYRPEETVRVKGWIRNLTLSDGRTLEFPGPSEVVTWTARDSFGNDLDAGQIRPDELGGFDLSFEILAGANLGQAWIEFQRPADPQYGYYTHSFQIQEFRRPEFEVVARTDSPGPHVVNEPATVAVEANYFSGGPLPDAPVEWRVTTRSASYSPPGWGDFTFGVWTPWWIADSFSQFGRDGYESAADFGYVDFQPGQESNVETFSDVTDASGTNYLRMDFTGGGDGLPSSVTAEPSVTDVNRQVWSDSTELLVHPSSMYVGLRSTRTFVQVGEPLDIEAVVASIDGSPIVGRDFSVVAERLVNRFVDGAWVDAAVESETCDSISGTEPVSCTFAMATGGRWRISADVVDDSGLSSHTEMTRWVVGGDAVPSRSLDLEEATLVPDQATYAAGDTAQILVESPFGSATGLVTYGSGEIQETQTFKVDGGGTVLDIPISDDNVPSVQVDVELVGTAVRLADDGTLLQDVAARPAYASGSLVLRVPPVSRSLNVSVTTADGPLAPGSSTTVDVVVSNAGGSPVEGAQMLVVMVDEAILALSGYELLDPIEVFYRDNDSGFQIERGRDSILLENPHALVDLIQQGARLSRPPDTTTAAATAESAVAPQAAGSAKGFAADDAAAGFSSDGPAVDVRQNFDALAVFAPDVVTDANGMAHVGVDLPDGLTRYRVMVVAVDGPNRFGTGESTITAQLPLQVRPSAPRFLNFGDQFELPIVVQNLTDADTEVDVIIETSNLEIVGSAGRQVTVPANDRVEVRFPVRADSAGTARFRAAAVSGANVDATTVSLPVYTPATAEAFATYGVVDDGAIVQPLLAPAGVFPQFGGLEIDTSSTALQALTDAVLYLTDYEYRSADAYASRILAISALRDVLGAFHANGLPTPAELNSTVKSDIAALSALQNFDGGFGSWRRDQQSSPYRSIQAVQALVEAKRGGFAVSPEVMENGRAYLRDIESHLPADWGRATKDMLIAYSLHVRALDGDVDSAVARALWNRSGTTLGFDALAWIWPVVSDAGTESEIARTFANRVTETPQAATFVTSYGDDDWLVLNSDRRTDGIVLGALVEMDPTSDLIPKVVAGLIANQVKGRWNNVQENAFILLALNSYFDTFESVDPDFVARVWLGDLYTAEHTFAGRSTDAVETRVPMAELILRDGGDLLVEKDGVGRLYYRLGLRYAPDDLALDPLDHGFVVQRSYEGIDDPSDVWLDTEGTWHVKSGAEVRVRITMVNDSRRTNMALIDSLPAGFEPLNPELATTGELPPIEVVGRLDGETEIDGPSWWWGPWFDHQNLRDDRAEAFAAWLSAGTHSYTYAARATTPGSFVAPPARAEEIYAPEVFGRSGTDTIVVEDPASIG